MANGSAYDNPASEHHVVKWESEKKMTSLLFSHARFSITLWVPDRFMPNWRTKACRASNRCIQYSIPFHLNRKQKNAAYQQSTSYNWFWWWWWWFRCSPPFLSQREPQWMEFETQPILFDCICVWYGFYRFFFTITILHSQYKHFFIWGVVNAFVFVTVARQPICHSQIHNVSFYHPHVCDFVGNSAITL